MCEPVSLSLVGAYLGGSAAFGAAGTTLLTAGLYAAGGAAAGAAAGYAVGKAGQSAMQGLLPKPVTPGTVATPQAGKVPQMASNAGKMGGAGFGGSSPTLLTGPKGDLAQDSLLGRNTLLGA